MRSLCLESGLKIAPQRADLLAALGESYFMAGKVDKAIEVFNQLRKIDNSARSYAFLGLSYRNLGRFDEAKTLLPGGLQLDPHSASCLYNLGFIAERQGDSAEAESIFSESAPGQSETSPTLLLSWRIFASPPSAMRMPKLISGGM